MSEYLIAVDLEGAHGVVGEPYSGLYPGMAEYNKAVESMTKEVNAAVRALYDGGATEVFVWDNHANLNNLDFTEIDSRAKKIKISYKPSNRFDFVKEHNFSGIVFLGYHAMDGSIGGVLAHTYNSGDIQYYKFNGKPIGEFDFDGYIVAEFGIPTLFLASDDVCVKQFESTFPEAVTSLTKIGKGRNAAEFLEEDAVLQGIYDGVRRAIDKKPSCKKLKFPVTVEVRYTRMEKAADVLQTLSKNGIDIHYGEDAHILQGTAHNIDELRAFL